MLTQPRAQVLARFRGSGSLASGKYVRNDARSG